MKHVEKEEKRKESRIINKYGKGVWSDISNREVNEHVKVWEEYHNQPVPKKYCIHHIDYDKFNNDPLNLQLMLQVDHCSLHATGRKQTPEAKLKIGAAHKGTHPKMPACTEEKKKKIGDSRRRPEVILAIKKYWAIRRLKKYLDSEPVNEKHLDN